MSDILYTVAESEVVDPVTTEVIRNALDSVSQQMSVTIERSAFSTIVREVLDFSTALFDNRGRIIAQASRIPVHINSMSTALENILRNLAGRDFFDSY